MTSNTPSPNTDDTPNNNNDNDTSRIVDFDLEPTAPDPGYSLDKDNHPWLAWSIYRPTPR